MYTGYGSKCLTNISFKEFENNKSNEFLYNKYKFIIASKTVFFFFFALPIIIKKVILTPTY